MRCWSTPSSPWSKTGRSPNGPPQVERICPPSMRRMAMGIISSVNTIHQRFPNARFVASRDAIEVMREQLSPPWLNAYWKSRFPGQIDPALAIAEALGGGVIQLEGEELVSIPMG